ncbi:polysaccharide export outer membrane protein [Mucilaginibacter yixingensis]|uniref:Polysaccharide export outer membrane protein n=1 Tax=Mucilaginibacter yixingensis TaxID=1295612 RepID=A0A2T5J9D9_9SPHI|nr:polysaccharide biosynthesis/export family protein [Mucilaginibacter yixingensis]PTQ96692.1 polysaccharide export outer membrane protein [Mucilaginibacter yixingensis]
MNQNHIKTAKKIAATLVLSVLLSACAAKRDLVYFSNLGQQNSVAEAPGQEVVIATGDIVNVSVVSGSLESDKLFQTNLNNGPLSTGYKVNAAGDIALPLIGETHIAGLTTAQAETAITTQLSKQIKNPGVEVKIINFKVTVVGEVNKPSTFTVPDGKVNLLEALGLAGDMTVYGKRENVLVIRQENGVKTVKRLNLNNVDVMQSPYFNLKQNDIVYVEPDRSKAVEYSQNTRLMPLVIASISALAVLAAVLKSK